MIHNVLRDRVSTTVESATHSPFPRIIRYVIGEDGQITKLNEGEFARKNAKGVTSADESTSAQERRWIMPDLYREKLESAKVKLAGPIKIAREDDIEVPSDAATMSASDVLDLMDAAYPEHEKVTFATEEGEWATHVSDHQGNFVSSECEEDGTVALYFKVFGYQTFDNPRQIPQDFVQTLLRSLKRGQASS
ncbi:hypothetical protein F4X33_18485 [Candidatus Poribacteria bacterium]|nr:hypothetical protein [Candidatus Poribacteria bacterium]